MCPFNRSFVEVLESRIAPAGLVTAHFDHGTLTLTGDGTANDYITLLQLGPKNFVLRGYSTAVRLDAGPTSDGVFLGDITGDVIVNLGSGSDYLTLVDVKLPHDLIINLGAGDNAFEFRNSSVGHDLKYTGGDDGDSLTFTGVRDTIGGSMSDTNGNGDNNLLMLVNTLQVGSNFTVTGGTGSESITANGTVLAIKGALSIDHLKSSSSTIDFQPVSVNIGAGFDLKSGSGADYFRITSHDARIGGSFTVNTGTVSTGSDNFSLVGSNLKIGGLLSIEHSARGVDARVLNRIALSRLSVGGDLQIKNDGGESSTSIEANTIDIGGSVSVSAGDHPGTIAGISFSAKDRATIKGNFSVSNGIGQDSDYIRSGNTLSIGGNLLLTNANATDRADVDLGAGLFTSIKGSTTVTSGDGIDTVSLSSGEKLMLGSVSITAGASNDSVVISGESVKIKAALSLSMGAGSNSTTLAAYDHFDLGGDLTYSASARSGVTFNAGSALLHGNATFTTPDGLDSSFAGQHGKISVLKNLTFDASASTSGTSLNASGLKVVGAFHFTGGNGIDSLIINDSLFFGATTIATGGGGDPLLIENNAFLTGTTTFSGPVTIDLGSDGDLLTIGSPSPATRTRFLKSVTFDGGTENDFIEIDPNTFFGSAHTTSNFP